MGTSASTGHQRKTLANSSDSLNNREKIARNLKGYNVNNIESEEDTQKSNDNQSNDNQSNDNQSNDNQSNNNQSNDNQSNDNQSNDDQSNDDQSNHILVDSNEQIIELTEEICFSTDNTKESLGAESNEVIDESNNTQIKSDIHPESSVELKENLDESNDEQVDSRNSPVDFIGKQAESKEIIDWSNDETVDSRNSPVDYIGKQAESKEIIDWSNDEKVDSRNSPVDYIWKQEESKDGVNESNGVQVESTVKDREVNQFTIQLICSSNKNKKLTQLIQQVFDETLNIKVVRTQFKDHFNTANLVNKNEGYSGKEKLFVCLFEDQATPYYIEHDILKKLDLLWFDICLVIFHEENEKPIKPVKSVPMSVPFVQYVYKTEKGNCLVQFQNKSCPNKTTVKEFLERNVIIVCNQTSLTPEIKDFLEQKLRLRPYIDNINDRSRDGYVIVFCIERSRLVSDIQEVIKTPQIAKNCCIVVLRHRESHTLDTDTFNINELIRADEYLKQFGSVIECVFNNDNKIYDCDVNIKAGKLIRQFLKLKSIHVKMGAGANKPVNVSKDKHDQEQASDAYSMYNGSIDQTPIEPWRHVGSESFDTEFCSKLIMDIEKLKPESSPDAKMNVAIIGHKAAGKSSFINTLQSHFFEYVTQLAITGKSPNSVTSKYTKYSIRKPNLKHIWLCDTRGIDNDFGLTSKDFDYLLNGNIKDGYVFDPKVAISPENDKFLPEPKLDDKIHCVCFVFDGNASNTVKSSTFQMVKSFLDKIGKKELRFIILLTKMDKLCNAVAKDVTNIYKSKTVESAVNWVATKLSIATSDIIPVVNYDRQTEIVVSLDAIALLALRQMIRRCNDFISNPQIQDTDDA